MIRPFTLIAMLLAAGSGAYLFAVKHRAQVLDDQLAAVAEQSRQDGQRIRVLQAQWALEIDPTRLGQLAAQFTDLQPMKPAQLVTVAALQASLPPAGSAAPGSNPAGDTPQLDLQPGAGLPVASATPVLPLPPEPAPAASSTSAPALLASAASPPAAVRATHPVAHATHSPSALHFAGAELPRPVPLSQTLATQSVPHMTPIGAQVMSVKAVSAPVDSAVATGSLLGMAANMPPPQPLPAGGPAN
jgi:hypothetical protein